MRLFIPPLLVLVACGDNLNQQPDPSADASADSADDIDASPPVSRAGFAVISNKGVPCNPLDGCSQDSNVDLVRIDFDGETGLVAATKLTDNSDRVPPQMGEITPDDDNFLALSPDGEFVYFSNFLGGVGQNGEPNRHNIFRVHASGAAEPKQLTPSESRDLFVALSADGSTIWYVSNASGTLNVHSMSSDGSAARQVSDLPFDVRFIYGIAPDETAMIISIDFPDTQNRELRRLNLATGELLPLTTNGLPKSFQAISADGSRVVFQERIDGVQNLWSVPTDATSPPAPLTSFTEGSSVEAVAVTGPFVIFEQRTQKKQIYAVPVSGGEVRKLTNPAAGESSFFRLLDASGTRIVYTTNDNPLPDGSGDTELFVVPAVGGASTLLTPEANDSYFLPNAHIEATDLIIYNSPISGFTHLFSVPVDGGDNVDLTPSARTVTFRGLSPTGDLLFYVRSAGEENPVPDLYMTRVGGEDRSDYRLTDNLVPDFVDAIFVGSAVPTPDRTEDRRVDSDALRFRVLRP